MITEPINALHADIDNYNLRYPGHDFAIIGDLNAHCASVLNRNLPDTRVVTRGRLLIDMAQNQNLTILKGTAPHNFGPTLIRSDVLSIIDYAVTTIDMEANMLIHDFSHFSEHASIQLTTKIEHAVLPARHTGPQSQLPHKKPPLPSDTTLLDALLSQTLNLRKQTA
jgi:hypothetical protein